MIIYQATVFVNTFYKKTELRFLRYYVKMVLYYPSIEFGPQIRMVSSLQASPMGTHLLACHYLGKHRRLLSSALVRDFVPNTL